MRATGVPPAMLDRFVHRRLAANSLLGGIRFVITAGVYLGVYPFMLRSLGSDQFGLWALLCVPSQYIALGDLGISNALIKLISEDYAHESTTRLLELAGAAVVLFSVVGAVITGGAFLWRSSIISWLRIQPEFIQDANVLLVGMAAVIWLTLLGNVYIALLSGLHRMDLAHTIQTSNAVLNAAGILVSLVCHAGLMGLLLSSALAAFVTWIFATLLALRIARVSWLTLPKLSWRTTKGLLNFGAYMYVAALSALLLEPSVKILLSRYGGLEFVSCFELASRAVIQVRSFFCNIMLPLLPASSLLMMDRERIRELFGRSMRLLWLTAIPMFIALSILSRPIMHAWLGKDVPLAHGALSLLAMGWLLNVLTLPAYFLVQGMNHPRSAMWCSLMQGLICVGGGYLLIPRMGFYGAITSEVIGLSVAAVYIFLQFAALCPLRSRDIFSTSRVRALGLPATMGLFLWFLLHSPVLQSPWAGIAAVVGVCMLYAMLLYRRSSDGFTALELLRSYLPLGPIRIERQS